jgi:hypothetical protein
MMPPPYDMYPRPQGISVGTLLLVMFLSIIMAMSVSIAGMIWLVRSGVLKP